MKFHKSFFCAEYVHYPYLSGLWPPNVWSCFCATRRNASVRPSKRPTWHLPTSGADKRHGVGGVDLSVSQGFSLLKIGISRFVFFCPHLFKKTSIIQLFNTWRFNLNESQTRLWFPGWVLHFLLFDLDRSLINNDTWAKVTWGIWIEAFEIFGKV